MEILQAEGAALEYHDPHIASVRLSSPIFGTQGRQELVTAVPLSVDRIRGADCVVILVGHDLVDYAKVLQHAKRVFDAVNATKGMSGNAEVERL